MPVHVRTIERLIATMVRSLLLAIPVIFITLAFAFRSVSLAATSILPNALPLAAIALFLAATGAHIGVAGALSFSVALGIAVDDTIHFIDRYRRLRRHAEPQEAIVSAWRELARVMAITTVIFLAGFGTLLLSGFTGVRYFGGLCCLAFLVAAAADLLILPALLALQERTPRNA